MTTMRTDRDEYAARVGELEAEGLTTSDAQAAVDAETIVPGPVDETNNVLANPSTAKAKPTTNAQRRAKRAAATAKSPKPAKASGRAVDPKADPARVRAYFETTGLSRKELAAVLGKSTGLLAHVTRETGDRWSVSRFEAAVKAIEKHLKAKKVERPIAEPITPATLAAFLVPESQGKPKRRPRTEKAAAIDDHADDEYHPEVDAWLPK